jgi:Xaa-Pro aminopeptidase
MTDCRNEVLTAAIKNRIKKGNVYVYSTNNNTPQSEIDQRIEKLRKQLEENNIGAALLVQRADLLYFAGSVQEAHLYVPVDGEPILMIFRSLDRAIAESSLRRIVPLDSPRAIPDLLDQYGYKVPPVIGMELDVLPANLYFSYQRLFEEKNLVDISHLIRLVRAIKSPYEVDLMRRAAEGSDQVAACVTGAVKCFTVT